LSTVTWAYSGERNWRDAAGFERMSVARYVTPNFPPTFISAGNADPLLPQSELMHRRLRENGVAVTALFFPADHEPRLAHEYQFNLDQADGRLAFGRAVAWLNGRDAPAAPQAPPELRLGAVFLIFAGYGD
jgi:acetyl esterase/lipase